MALGLAAPVDNFGLGQQGIVPFQGEVQKRGHLEGQQQLDGAYVNHGFPDSLDGLEFGYVIHPVFHLVGVAVDAHGLGGLRAR